MFRNITSFIFNGKELFGRSSAWSSVRKEHLKNNPYCAACGRKDNLEVHHIIPYQLDPSKELDPDNLITLCGKYCHFVFGHFMDWKSWNVNVIEDSRNYHKNKQQKPYKEEMYSSNSRSIYHEIFSFLYGFFIWPFNINGGND